MHAQSLGPRDAGLPWQHCQQRCECLLSVSVPLPVPVPVPVPVPLSLFLSLSLSFYLCVFARAYVCTCMHVCVWLVGLLVGNMGNRARRTHGTAARSLLVAHLLASEARRSQTRAPVRSAANDPTYCLVAGDRSRESCGTVDNSLELPLLPLTDQTD